jgi:hypothetical protein
MTQRRAYFRYLVIPPASYKRQIQALARISHARPQPYSGVSRGLLMVGYSASAFASASVGLIWRLPTQIQELNGSRQALRSVPAPTIFRW